MMDSSTELPKPPKTTPPGNFMEPLHPSLNVESRFKRQLELTFRYWGEQIAQGEAGEKEIFGNVPWGKTKNDIRTERSDQGDSVRYSLREGNKKAADAIEMTVVYQKGNEKSFFQGISFVRFGNLKQGFIRFEYNPDSYRIEIKPEKPHQHPGRFWENETKTLEQFQKELKANKFPKIVTAAVFFALACQGLVPVGTPVDISGPKAGQSEYKPPTSEPGKPPPVEASAQPSETTTPVPPLSPTEAPADTSNNAGGVETWDDSYMAEMSTAFVNKENPNYKNSLDGMLRNLPTLGLVSSTDLDTNSITVNYLNLGGDPNQPEAYSAYTYPLPTDTRVQLLQVTDWVNASVATNINLNNVPPESGLAVNDVLYKGQPAHIQDLLKHLEPNELVMVVKIGGQFRVLVVVDSAS